MPPSRPLRNPQPYVRATRSDLTVTARDTTLTRQEDGTYAGRVPVIVRSGTDAPHKFVMTETTLPEGVQFTGIEPSEACGGTWCPVAGGPLLAGETRQMYLPVSAPADTPAGVLGTGSLRADINGETATEDVDPSDDTATFTLTVG